ncbi:MAG: DUF2169 domain-containing protein [Planctomycetes bacterium]|nr:DUF2169 domain-containing protein [Planctomycetota bacterium]
MRFADEPAWGLDDGTARVPSDLCDGKPGTDVVLVEPADPVVAATLAGRSVRVELGGVALAGKLGRPWQFGPVARDDRRRRKLAGTYDDDWVQNRMPFLPADFDARYHQAAPPRQVSSPHLHGDELVRFDRLHHGRDVFVSHLPDRVAVIASVVGNTYRSTVATLDTVLFAAEAPRMSLVWRSAIVPRRSIEEVSTVFAYAVRLRTAREVFATE